MLVVLVVVLNTPRGSLSSPGSLGSHGSYGSRGSPAGSRGRASLYVRP